MKLHFEVFVPEPPLRVDNENSCRRKVLRVQRDNGRQSRLAAK